MSEKVTAKNKTLPRMRSIRAVAKETGLSYDAIRKMCLRNEIVYIRCGTKFLINLDWFIDYLNNSGRAVPERSN